MKKNKTEFSGLERLTDVYLVLLMTVLVFAVSPGGYLEINEVKKAVFYWLCGGYVSLTVLLYAEELLIGRRRAAELQEAAASSSWTIKMLLVYLVLTLLSAFFSPHGKISWLGATRSEGAVTIGIYVLSALMVSCFGRAKQWHLHLLAATVAVQSAICILQLNGGNPLGLYPEGVGWADAGKLYSGAYLGTIGNVDFLGAFFSLAVPLLLAASLRLKTPWRFAWLAGAALAVYVMARMWVLSCLVGVIAGCTISLLVILPLPDQSRRRVLFLLLHAAVALIAIIFAVDFQAGPLHSLHELLHGRVPRAVDSGRLYIWKEVLLRVPKHLLLGTGPDTMALADIPPFRRYDEGLGIEAVGYIDAAHNQYLNVLYHQGACALVAELAALIALALFWFRAGREKAAPAILGTAVLCYSIQAFFNISTPFVSPLAWTVLGLLEGCRERDIIQKKVRRSE